MVELINSGRVKVVVKTEDREDEIFEVPGDELFNELYAITAEYMNEINIFTGFDATNNMPVVELTVVDHPFRVNEMEV